MNEPKTDSTVHSSSGGFAWVESLQFRHRLLFNLVVHSALFTLALLLAFLGLSVAVITASTSALVSDLSRASAYGASLGVLSSVMDVGQASGPPLVGLVITIWGYPLGFALICAVLLAAALLFATHFRPPRPAETVATEEALRAR